MDPNALHNPNPFDFVPFGGREPRLYTRAYLEQDQQMVSGFLELQLTALTPVHIVGSMTRGENNGQSRMYRQAGQPCIPGSTIRGCLRAFIEALTAGWVSQANASYPSLHGKRHIGFATFEEGRTLSYGADPYDADPAVDPAFKPPAIDSGEMDIATYLFGIVSEGDVPDDQKRLAAKGKVFIEDALLVEESLDAEEYWVPDLGPADAEAFFGGAHPSASNWWYMTPGSIERNEPHGLPMVEFEGKHLRGRKFYYHQQPLRCLGQYRPDHWPYDAAAPFYPIRLEAMSPQSQSRPFRIYFERVPGQLLRLLVVSLLPGQHMRHKLGYGKPFGYGSIAFSLLRAKGRVEQTPPAIPSRLGSLATTVNGWIERGWYRDAAQQTPLEGVHGPSLNRLAQILGTHGMNGLVFTYPPYQFPMGNQPPTVFGRPVWQGEVHNANVNLGPATRTAASRLWNTKRPIDLSLYQQRSNGWDIISRRKP